LRPVVEALGQLGQAASLTAIAKASTQSPLLEVSASALIKIAAGLKADDYGTLPLQTVPASLQRFTSTPPETRLVILKALAHVGDGRAVKTVEFLATTAFRGEVREGRSATAPPSPAKSLSLSDIVNASPCKPGSRQRPNPPAARS